MIVVQKGLSQTLQMKAADGATVCGDGSDKLDATWSDSQDVNISLPPAITGCSGLIAMVCSGVGKLQRKMLSNNVMREGLGFKQSSKHEDGSCWIITFECVINQRD